MSNIPQEAGKVASGAIDALKGSPGLLVLVLLQAATLAMLYFAVEHNRERQQDREMALLERCFPLDREKN
jgi:hypothetical protein